MERSLRLGIGMILLPLLAVGCLDSFSKRQRQPGSSAWVTAETAVVDGPQLSDLAALGARELFVESGRMTFIGGTAQVEPLPLPAIQRGTEVTLGLTGALPAGEIEVGEASQTLFEELRRFRIEAESRGLVPVGFHLTLVVAADRLPELGELVSGVRRELDREMLLSLELDPEWLQLETAAELVDAVDFVTCTVYGPPADGRDDPSFWDLEETMRRVELLETLGAPYLLGVRTTGELQHRNRQGEVLASRRDVPLQALIDQRSLEVEPVFSFKGFYRQVIRFSANHSVRVGDWTVTAGETLELSRPTVYHLAGIRDRLESVERRRGLGYLYHRLAGPKETLVLSSADLAQLADAGPLKPPLGVDLQVVTRSARRWTVILRLSDGGPLGTAMALVDHNYVSMELKGALVGAVELGDFRRMELLRSGSEQMSVRSIRSANVLRLYYPMMDEGFDVRSGPIDLRLQSAQPELRLSASFLLPDGETLEVGPFLWSEPTPEPEDEAPAPAPESAESELR